MQTHKPGCVSLSCRPIQFKGRIGLSLSAALYFPFREQEPFGLWSEASMWSFLAREMPEPLIDEGVIKTRPEYLVHGIAHPPQRPATQCRVRACVGALEKTLVVNGERIWRGAHASVAAPFESMPLTWQRAYGGTDHAANPLGIGRRGPTGPQRLANVEYPHDAADRPDREIEPAGFGRIDPMWATRAKHRGTYDERWLPDHSPGFAPDLNWRHFNLAPPDQWFDAPLGGNERFEFDHLHPARPRVSGRLPGLACRCFLHYRGGPHAGQLRTITLTPGTLWFFPHAERAILIYQGLADLCEDDAADVGIVLIGVERIGESKTDAHYAQVLARREDPRLGALHSLRESDLTPAGLDLHDPEMAAIELDYKVEGFLGEAQHRGAGLRVEQARERVRELGLDPDVLGVRMPLREPVPSVSELPDHVEKLLVESAAQTRQALLQSARDVVEANEIARVHGIDPRVGRPKGPPDFRASNQLRALAAAAAASTDPRGLAAQLLDLAPKLAQAEAALRMAYVQAAHLQAPADRLSAAAAAAHREQVLAWLRAGKGLAFMDLTGADLSGLDLSGVDLHGAQMESANLAGSRLVGANLSHAVLAHAGLEDADFRRARLVGANLGTPHLRGARFDDADLSAAILSSAALVEVSFRDATLTGAQCLDTTFRVCDWRGVKAAGVTLLKRTLAGLNADGADLSGANFIECTLDGASFRSAILTGANFVQCSARGVPWAEARLSQAVFAQGCELGDGDFSSAELAGANLRGAHLVRAVFREARLDDADLSEADLTEADLQGASLQRALLIRTTLQRARAARSNWMHTIAHKADLRATDLRGANLHGADLAQVWLDADSRLEQANVERLKVHPRRRVPAAGAAT
jgi:uncharacterized protein YjbI with pentapeptide repeats